MLPWISMPCITITEVIGYDFNDSDDCNGNDYGGATLIAIFIVIVTAIGYHQDHAIIKVIITTNTIIKVIATLITIIKVIVTTNATIKVIVTTNAILQVIATLITIANKSVSSWAFSDCFGFLKKIVTEFRTFLFF